MRAVPLPFRLRLSGDCGEQAGRYLTVAKAPGLQHRGEHERRGKSSYGSGTVTAIRPNRAAALRHFAAAGFAAAGVGPGVRPGRRS